MKKILGLDVGTTSIGWALVNESEDKSEIIKLGVRVNPLSADELSDFEKGKPLTTNANRTAARGARRNLQRFKLRRENLIEILEKNKLISKETALTEIGKDTTHQTLSLRAKAVTEKITLSEFSKVLLAINKKRGYKSNRKIKEDTDGQSIDGMSVAKELYDKDLTVGQYVYERLSQNKTYIPDFYRSDLQKEFDEIWKFQKQFHKETLDDELYASLKNQGLQNSRKRFLAIKSIYTAENKGKKAEVKMKHYKWRVEALSEKLPIEQVAYVLCEVNNNTNKSSGYLGEISDRSKNLAFNKLTVGEFLFNQIKEDAHRSLKGQVFYRQDYLDEFESIWENQTSYYPEILTHKLKKEIRDVVIFYQRKLKSQKGLLSFCLFESKKQEYVDKLTGKVKSRMIGRKVISKSNPIFQEFKIWQNLNNVVFENEKTDAEIVFKKLDESIKKEIFEELNLRGNLKPKDLLSILTSHLDIGKLNQWSCNFKEIEGNQTNKAIYNAYQLIAENKGYGFDWSSKTAGEIKEELHVVFSEIGIDTRILDFDSGLSGSQYTLQQSYKLWHLLYAGEEGHNHSKEDIEVFGNTNIGIKKILVTDFGFKPVHAKILSAIQLKDDYSSLSTKAMKKILPHLMDGLDYSKACEYVGYNHSNSLSKEENEKRKLKEKLDLVPKNSLRNPVVEKILNQMVNVVNQVSETYGRPDEIRIELARELKKSAKQRKDLTAAINSGTKANKEIRKIIEKDFKFKPTKSDVIKYKLYRELKENGYKTIYTNYDIPYEQLFSNLFDIEHIIPKSLLYDDSFSNKTLALKRVNQKKSNRTAYDFIQEEYQSDYFNFEKRVTGLFKTGSISKSKQDKLFTSKENLSDTFIARDLVNTQYIAKKAKELLLECFRTVSSTGGRITDILRADWGLINVMKELNLPKYKAAGLTEIEERKEGKKVEVIKDWSKRNDHRHHAMDALTIAFTTRSHVQYINTLNASNDTSSKLYGIENKITKESKKGNKKRKFIAPMDDFRTKAKEELERVLISFKHKNKVVTKNINTSKVKGGYIKKEQPSPRGQLHKETVYGKAKVNSVKPLKLSPKTTIAQLALISDRHIKEVVLLHLSKFDNKIAIAFDKKTLKKEPILVKDKEIKEVPVFEEIYTIRKQITPDNFKTQKVIDKVIDSKTRAILSSRFLDFDNDPKKAFSDLNKNPIWLNKDKGIAIKRVTIKGVNEVEALHFKKDHLGKEILDKNGNKQAVDFVSTGNNHHVAIYKDEKGKLQEKVVSFYEAVERVNQDLEVVDKNHNLDLGWEFQFTLKQNEMFVFPSEDFNPLEIDLLDSNNLKEISKHLFRVQKISKKIYWFRHHLETLLLNEKSLREKTWNRIGLSGIKGIVKVRINHIGEIVEVGEY